MAEAAADTGRHSQSKVLMEFGREIGISLDEAESMEELIGSGPAESACNTIVKQRAKRAGMHWTTHGLDAILALRTLQQSHRDHILWPTPQT